jgi:hypothetical protein
MLDEAVMMASPSHLACALAWEIEPLFVQNMVVCGEGGKCPSARSMALARKMGEEVS